MESWMRRLVGACLLGTFLPIATVGCFGRFELTRKVYRWNQEVDQDKWIRWLAFLGLIILPIYEFSTLIDVLFANSVEFWSGKNPVATATRVIEGEDGELLTLTRRGTDVLDVTVERRNQPPAAFSLVREPDALSAWDAEGRLLARVMDVNGAPTIVAGALAR
jgi:hypothetical protein